MSEQNSKQFGVIREWYPDNKQFWKSKGEKIARRNLWISIPCLLLAFCVWMLFSIISVYLNQIGFSFTTSELFSLTAIPSISGALLRIPYSFVIPIIGGRRWTAFSTIILVVPCLWLSSALQNPNTPYGVFMLISLLCGFGGANFASSMANISLFFPKSKQGFALGLNGGLGNLGVSVIQFFAPIVIFIPFWATQSSQMTAIDIFWLQNASLVWVPLLILFAVIALLGMNDLSSSMAPFQKQMIVLKNGHLWLLSFLYLCTFGSFIGFSSAFATLSKIEFPTINITMFAFSGPLVGALGRPIGGWLSDKFGGLRVTFVTFLFMILFMILLFFTLSGDFATSDSFYAFYICFLFLFFAAGFGSGSTFQISSIIYREVSSRVLRQSDMNNADINRQVSIETSAALGFISAIGAIGGFFIPQCLSFSLVTLGSVNLALSTFLIFYIVCTIITKGYYARLFPSY